LRKFADAIGVPAAGKLRKDELEKIITHFLATGKIESAPRKIVPKSAASDLDKGLALDLPVVHYNGNRATKDFIASEAQKQAPHLKQRSGARYRLNRWREEQLANGVQITYGDLVKQYIALNASEEPFARIPHGRYINFVADFLANEENGTRRNAIRAWEALKTMDSPKDYNSWRKSCSVKSRPAKD
jgi:hypothetical protein